jgi:hypothetical protein
MTAAIFALSAPAAKAAPPVAFRNGNSSGTFVDFAGQISPNRLLYGG